MQKEDKRGGKCPKVRYAKMEGGFYKASFELSIGRLQKLVFIKSNAKHSYKNFPPSKVKAAVLTLMYLVEKRTYSIPTTIIGRTDCTRIPTTVVRIGIPTKLLGTVYFDKSCQRHSTGQK